MREQAVFPTRALLIFVALAAALFALSIYLVGFAAGRQDTTGPSSFSRSAIGYAGLAELLHRLGTTVVKARDRRADLLGRGDLLIVAEPPLSSTAEEDRLALDQGHRALVILPKWHGIADETHPGWIKDALPKGLEAANWVLALTGAKGRATKVPTPEVWTTNRLEVVPELGPEVQLLTDSDLEPIVATPQGVLVGERAVAGRRVRIVADPDILSNHGVLREANARFAVALLADLRGPDTRVVFDETIHGFRTPGPNPLRLPFEFPFSIATALGAGATAVMLWTSLVRFGRPHLEPPRLPAGKEMLIRNSARLIGLAGRGEPIVAAYVAAMIRDAGRRLRAPARLDEAGLVAWLERTGSARGVRIDLSDLARRAEALRRGGPTEPSMLVRLAGEAHRWKREMLNGA